MAQLIVFLIVGVLIWRRGDVPAGMRLLWTILAIASGVVPQILLEFLGQTYGTRFPLLTVLVPFSIVFAFLLPWIVFVIFKERYPRSAPVASQG